MPIGPLVTLTIKRGRLSPKPRKTKRSELHQPVFHNCVHANDDIVSLGLVGDVEFGWNKHWIEPQLFTGYIPILRRKSPYHLLDRGVCMPSGQLQYWLTGFRLGDYAIHLGK